MGRPRPLTIPVVTLIPTFKGLPMAMTGSPTATEFESPSVSGFSASFGASTCISATAVARVHLVYRGGAVGKRWRSGRRPGRLGCRRNLLYGHAARPVFEAVHPDEEKESGDETADNRGDECCECSSQDAILSRSSSIKVTRTGS